MKSFGLKFETKLKKLRTALSKNKSSVIYGIYCLGFGLLIVER